LLILKEICRFGKTTDMASKLRLITTHDLCLYKHVKLRAAQKEMVRIKDFHNKLKHQQVTNLDAADYYGIPLSLFESSLDH
tara:strand:- start:737 stop:979 length:243 start_codon:yes stop_codon:yes gene_type:complete